jgi:signal transduction histidine kinase
VPVDLHALLLEVAESLRETFGGVIEVQTELQAGRCTVLGDATQLRIALMTLGLCARDRMPERGRLSIATEDADYRPEHTGAYVGDDARPGRGPGLRVLFRDDGPRIDPAVAERLFGPFPAAGGADGACDISLASVQGSIVSHHGSIRVRAEPGPGNTFEILLPAAVE